MCRSPFKIENIVWKYHYNFVLKTLQRHTELSEFQILLTRLYSFLLSPDVFRCTIYRNKVFKAYTDLYLEGNTTRFITVQTKIETFSCSRVSLGLKRERITYQALKLVWALWSLGFYNNIVICEFVYTYLTP